MKKLLNKRLQPIIIIAALLAGSVVYWQNLTDVEKWLFFNSSRAETLANAMLNQETFSTPDWAIEMVISSSNGYVLFSEHNPDYLVAYSKIGTPERHKGIKWHHIKGGWYRGEIDVAT